MKNHYLSGCNILKNIQEEFNNNEDPIIKGIFQKIEVGENQIQNRIKSKKYFLYFYL